MNLIYVGEYSALQDAFHIQPLEKALKSNLRRALFQDTSNDWVPIFIGDREAVSRIVEAVREGQKQIMGGHK